MPLRTSALGSVAAAAAMATAPKPAAPTASRPPVRARLPPTPASRALLQPATLAICVGQYYIGCFPQALTLRSTTGGGGRRRFTAHRAGGRTCRGERARRPEGQKNPPVSGYSVVWEACCRRKAAGEAAQAGAPSSASQSSQRVALPSTTARTVLRLDPQGSGHWLMCRGCMLAVLWSASRRHHCGRRHGHSMIAMPDSSLTENIYLFRST